MNAPPLWSTRTSSSPPPATTSIAVNVRAVEAEVGRAVRADVDLERGRRARLEAQDELVARPVAGEPQRPGLHLRLVGALGLARFRRRASGQGRRSQDAQRERAPSNSCCGNRCVHREWCASGQWIPRWMPFSSRRHDSRGGEHGQETGQQPPHRSGKASGSVWIRAGRGHRARPAGRRGGLPHEPSPPRRPRRARGRSLLREEDRVQVADRGSPRRSGRRRRGEAAPPRARRRCRRWVRC